MVVGKGGGGGCGNDGDDRDGKEMEKVVNSGDWGNV